MTGYHISVQYGAGMHFFTTPKPIVNLLDAKAMMERIQKQRMDMWRKGGRGAKPTTRLWKCLLERTPADVPEERVYVISGTYHEFHARRKGNESWQHVDKAERLRGLDRKSRVIVIGSYEHNYYAMDAIHFWISIGGNVEYR